MINLSIFIFFIIKTLPTNINPISIYKSPWKKSIPERAISKNVKV